MAHLHNSQAFQKKREGLKARKAQQLKGRKDERALRPASRPWQSRLAMGRQWIL